MNSGPFSARLYAAHLPSAGIVVSARFFGERLHLEGAERTSVAASGLTVEAGGFDHNTLFLSWNEAGTRRSIQPVDAAARAVLLASAPPSMASALRHWQGGARRQSFKWQALSWAALGLIVAVVVAWSQYGTLVDWIAEKIPPETEASLGAATMEQLREEKLLIEDGPAVEAISAIGAKLTQGSRYTYHWAVKDDASINAFAMPGGYVVVHRGLIEAAASADELAGVLAHEVQHVERRHTLKGMITGVGWAALLTVVLGDVSAISGVLIYEAGKLSYSRDLESEADRLGVKALVAADIDPSGMASFFRTLAANNPGTIALLSSHPATGERIAAIEADIAALPKRNYAALTIDWPAVQASVAKSDEKAANTD